jgi:sugar O-acyltransferase (sialic acid O-acetyltransferase NeuD family)
MEINELTILGFSEATLTMILDNLESCGSFPDIRVLNNLNLTDLIPFENPAFDIKIIDHFPESTREINAFLGVYKSAVKQKVFDLLKHLNPIYHNVIHKDTAISSMVNLGKGIMVNSFVSIAAHTHIGNFVSINRNASVGHHTIVNDFATINPGATVAGHVNIGKGSMIGMGANIIDGITIGENTIIGAGSLVTKNVPDNVIAYGNPCKVVKANS